MMEEGDIRLGRIRRVDGGFEGRLERHIGHDRNIVWRKLTDASALPEWLAPGSIELRNGGAVRIDFADSGTTIDSTVLELDAPRLLVYSWSSGNEPARPLRWELETMPEGTRLVLTVGVPEGEDPAKACAGFDAHLEMLLAALEGVSIGFPFKLYVAARKGYQEQLGQ